MSKRLALAAAILLLAAIMTGCAVDTGIEPTPTQALGVDIIVPYATTTVSPDATPEPAALFITGDGEVVLNDDTLLAYNAGETGSTASSQYKQLRLGDTGEAVAAMQERLTQLGYYSAGISGVFDESTEDAVKLFERSYGTMQTGIATAMMQERLYSEYAMVYNSDAYVAAVEANYVLLEPGDTGANVIALQLRLQELGYPIAEITGVYDDQTGEAVSLFYEVYGKRGRDYAIVDMQKVLYSEDAIRYSTQSGADPEENALNLSMGQSGTRVTQMQIRLAELGYLAEANGVFDQVTFDAVSAFQVACRVEPTGVADVKMQQMLFSHEAPRSGELIQLYALLQWGDTGEAVRALQIRLSELGFYNGEPDGVFSDDMVSTVKLFQKSAGMEETGVATVELQELAYSDNAPLSPEKAAAVREDQVAASVIVNSAIRGDANEGVRELQQRLIDLGFLYGEADGKFGGATEQAVKDFQTALGVEATGEASSELVNLIYSDAAPERGEKYWKKPQNYSPLKIGDTGDDVVELQVRLYKLGYLRKEDVGDSVGTYEEYTAAAVNEVMKVLNFRRRDGRASAEFLTMLYSDFGDSLKK